MRRISYRPYFLLIFLFLCLMSFPKGGSERIRSAVVCSFAPCWGCFSFLKEKTLFLLTLPLSSQTKSPNHLLEMQRLSQENQLLRSQVENVREWLLHEDRIQEQAARYRSLI